MKYSSRHSDYNKYLRRFSQVSDTLKSPHIRCYKVTLLKKYTKACPTKALMQLHQNNDIAKTEIGHVH